MSESREDYTASEAMKMLNMSKATFHRKVKDGSIPSKVAPGKSHRTYPRKTIDALAQALQLVHEAQAHRDFSRSTPNEQQEEMDIGIKCFGSDFITPLPERIAFQLRNPYTFWSLKSGGHVVGYISMMHLAPEFLDDLLTGRRLERDIAVQDILPLLRNKPFDIYIDVLAVDPDFSPVLRHKYAKEIVSGFANAILNLIANRYQIRALYTVTSTDEGDRLVKRRGFQLMPGKSQVPARKAYVLPLDETGVKQLQSLSEREG